MRKTFEVQKVKESVNEQLSRTDEYATKEFKIGLCTVLEKILWETDNYKGFSFIDNDNSEFNTVGFYSRKYI
jgi:hypothetical protein